MSYAQISFMQERITELERQLAEAQRSIAEATVTVPWEAGYGPDYAPTAGDPVKSVRDLIGVFEKRLAEVQQARENENVAFNEQQQALREVFKERDTYARLLKELRQGYQNILEFRKLNSEKWGMRDGYGGRYGALTREELEGVIVKIDAALEDR